jgi:transketolase C-terminal domain/subunit
VQNAIEAAAKYDCVDIFTILTIPLPELSAALKTSITESKNVIVIEEHVQRGGLGEHLLMKLVESDIRFNNFRSLHAKGYPTKLYGDQKYYQEISGLDKLSIASTIEELTQK